MAELVSLSKQQEQFVERVNELQELLQVIQLKIERKKLAMMKSSKKPRSEYSDLTVSSHRPSRPTFGSSTTHQGDQIDNKKPI